jgi:hypothetical protein
MVGVQAPPSLGRPAVVAESLLDAALDDLRAPDQPHHPQFLHHLPSLFFSCIGIFQGMEAFSIAATFLSLAIGTACLGVAVEMNHTSPPPRLRVRFAVEFPATTAWSGTSPTLWRLVFQLSSYPPLRLAPDDPALFDFPTTFPFRLIRCNHRLQKP